MTIEEAIRHCRETAAGLRKRGEALDVMVQGGEDCKECAAEHEQLAAWLEELQRKRAEIETLRRMALNAVQDARRAAVVQSRKAVESTRREVELARKRAPIIAVDFDGTLCENAWPDIGETKWETVQALIAAQAAGARLILWTNRVGTRLAEAVEWARQRELEFDAVNANLPETLAAFTTDCRKVYADIYLDDKAAQPSAAVLETLWETARATMNGEEEQPQARNPAHRGAVTAEQFEAIWNDDDGEEGGEQI